MASPTIQLRNSTAEFLLFTSQADEGAVWLSQKLMVQLFDVNVRTVNEHWQNIFTAAVERGLKGGHAIRRNELE
ncbi:MAG: hypothetical protein QM533_08365 [Cytophagales bacterium]|nr:hypothetical protein [Cytophagales bacterium]